MSATAPDTTMPEREAMPCRPDRPADGDPTWYCTTHAGWVYAEDECEGQIGSLHCNLCFATGCRGDINCECHDPADARYVETFE